jgi:hypothetical protein
MTRLGLTVLIAAALTLLFGPEAVAYEHLGEQVGNDVLEKHWPTSLLPIRLTVDGAASAAFMSEISVATNTWDSVPTARIMWGAVSQDTVDYTKTNFESAWGDLSGDGKHEVVIDADGSIIRDLGFVPAAVNGFGESGGTIHNGQAEINDMYLLINGQRTNFDRQATEIHELGHTLGLAHSTVGFAVGKDGALMPETDQQVPTMHPYSAPTPFRQTLEADDVASLGDMYPNTDNSFHTTFGSITGTVTRCSGEPVAAANVRAIKADDTTVQLARITGADGSYTINGVPPGDYFVVVEPLSGDDEYVDREPIFTRVDGDFTQEFLNETKESDCAQDTDPGEKESIPVGATGVATADFKVEGSSLAFVIDVTGSMGPELGGLKTGLQNIVDNIAATAGTFPQTTIVTFRDDSTLQLVSRDPDKLKDVINGLTTSSTADCPEGSNRALLTAARTLGSGGEAILVTDADSHRTGPTREAVEAVFNAKHAHLNTMLSGSCPPEQNPPLSPRRTLAPAFGPGPGAGPDQDEPVSTLGVENAVRTFSEESQRTGGLFTFQPEVKDVGDAEAQTRYVNTLANLGLSAVRPTVEAVNPAQVPRGAGLDVELTGSKTHFGGGSTVTVAGSGVTASAVRAQSATRMIVHLAAAAGAAQGFRDVTVHTGAETATGIGAVEVTAPPSGPQILSVTPSSGGLGATENVTISGALTHFGAGSVANLGAGVSVNHLTPTSPTSATASVSIAPGATMAFRDVSVTTGGEAAGQTRGFLVTAATPSSPRLTAASPRSGVRGATVDIALTGADTAFAGGASVASVTGTGVSVLSTTVRSPTSIVARLQISPTAPVGLRDLRVATGTQNAVLARGFEVKALTTSCTDDVAPASSLLKGKKGARAKKRKLVLHGRAHDDGCAAGKVARVDVAISRKAGSKCRFVTRSGKLTSARKCTRRVFVKARGTTSWSLTSKRKLPKGSYTVLVRARDAAGNAQSRLTKRKVRVR